jgi:hypothetical protein
MRKMLPFIVIAGAAAYFYSQINSFKSGLKARLGVIKFNLNETKQSGFMRIVLDVQLIINNPSKIQGKITGGNLDVMLQDKLVANISNFGDFFINAGTETTIVLKVALPTLSVVDSIATLIRNLGTGLTQNVFIRGAITTNLGRLDISENFKFNI